MSDKNAKGAGQTAPKITKNTSKSRIPSKITTKKTSKKAQNSSFDITKIFIAIFAFVMLIWIVLMAFITPNSKKEIAQNSQNIHQILETKKRKNSVLDKNITDTSSIQTNLAQNSNIDINTSDEAFNAFKDKLKEQKESFENAFKISQENITQNDEIYEDGESKKKADAPKYKVNLTGLKKHKKPSGAPKLAIIMDDISTKEQARNIKNLGINITPSIFPPENAHPASHELAKEFPVYMVHLPLSAINYTNEKKYTLRPGASKAEIDERIDALKHDFKGLKYINNHTGSAFTSDYNSALLLLSRLKAENIGFVDSLTISSSAVEKVANELKLPYVYRDTFLDNDKDTNKILKMLQTAVNTAKTDGVAIAICHPYQSTFEALKIAKNSVLKGVEVVYVDKIYEQYN